MKTVDAPAVSLRGIGKRYGRAVALAEVELDVRPGEVVGLVGPNGAGKSTLMRIIAGLSSPTEGFGQVAERPIGTMARQLPFVGLVTERPPFVTHLSGHTNLRLLAGIRRAIGRAEIDQAMVEVGLEPRSRKPVGSYSHGMKQRLALAQAIMEHPPILLLDEPTNGLDIEGSRLLRAVIQRQASDGAAIIMSSHSLADVEAVSSRVMMVEGGRVRELGLPGSAAKGGRQLSVVLAEEPPAWLIGNLGLRPVGMGRYILSIPGEPHEAVRTLVEAGAKVQEVSAAAARLEDVYLEALKSAS